MISLLILFFQVDIKEKIENAPDSSYEIGVFIGTYLPFALLVFLAYFIYYRMKKRKDLED
jgi:hypothetical protein